MNARGRPIHSEPAPAGPLAQDEGEGVCGTGIPAGRRLRLPPFEVKLPAGSAGAWCLVRVAASAPGQWWAKLDLTDGRRGHLVRQAFLGPMMRRRGWTWRSTLIHVPPDCDRLSLDLIGEGLTAGPVTVRVLGRRAVACRLLLHGWRLLPRAVAGDPAGLAGRLRALLGQAPARSGEAPPYEIWIALHDRPEPCERARLTAALAAAPVPGLQIVLLDPRGDEQARAASLTSLAHQWWAPAPLPVVTIGKGEPWPVMTGDWVAVFEAGESMAEDALGRVASVLQRLPDLVFLCADTDVLDAQGGRRSPRFKPAPDPILLPSGLLTTGVCVFRRDAVRWQSVAEGGHEPRLALACSIEAGGQARMLRLPFIMTHLPGHRAGSASVRWQAPEILPRVSVIVPTAGRSRHVIRCLRAVACGTDYPDLEILIAVSKVDPADRRQARTLRRLASLPRTRILDLGLSSFNYAEANNLAAASASGDCLLLLNDDVLPIEPLWLRKMASLLRGTTGIVGARLLYGNFMVQHAGVVMGLADLCEHDGKFGEGGDDSPGAFDRQVSAVTGACMLVRTDVYRAAGGLDTSFAIALNDVDFCLRAGAAGATTGYCAQAVLLHYESLSLGRHYAGDRSGLEATEIRLLRERWQPVIDEDPFYNPRASREPGREWQPGFHAEARPRRDPYLPPDSVLVDAHKGEIGHVAVP